MTFRLYRSFTFWTLAAAYLAVVFHRLAPAAVAVQMMRDLAAGAASMGFLAAAYFYPYALLQLPAGLLSDSWGPRRTASLSLVVAGVGSVLFALAPDAGWAVAARAVVGVGVAMVFVPSLKILAEWYPAEAYTTRIGILLAVGGVASYAAAEPLARISGVTGWRTVFAVVGFATLAAAFFVWRRVRDRPSEAGYEPPPDRTEAAPPIPLRAGLARVARTPAFWALVVWDFCSQGIYYTLHGMWGGPYLAHVHRMDAGEAGRILGASALGLAVCGPAMGWLSNRVVGGRKPVIVASSAALALLVWGLAAAGDRAGPLALSIGSFWIGALTIGVAPVTLTAAKELFPTQMAGTATGALNFFPFASAAILQPLLGAVIDSRGRQGDVYTPEGYATAFAILLALAVASLAASLFIRETYRKDLPHPG